MRVCALAACYQVDNSDCEIRCGAEGACPSELSCVGGFCVEDGQTCIDPGLVLAYSLDGIDDGQVADHSGAGNNAGVEGPRSLIDGKHGKAIAFDGMDDFLITQHSPSLAVAPGGASTVSFWIDVKKQIFESDQIIVGKVVDNTHAVNPLYEFGIEFRKDSELLELLVGTDNDAFMYTIEVPFDQFVHVALTWDGQRVKTSLDGELQPFSDRSLEVTIPDRGKNLMIGAQSNEGELFTGALDDLPIDNRALSGAELEADRSSPVAP